MHTEYINPTAEQLELFLKAANDTFYVPLSAKRDLGELASKVIRLGHCIMAWNGGPVGAITWYDNDKETAYFNILAVLPQFRRNGIAKQLLLRAVEQLPGNIKLARLNTRNPAAYNLYIQNGFSPESRNVPLDKLHETGCDLIKPIHD